METLRMARAVNRIRIVMGCLAIATVLPVAGCRTFNYTEDDLERERKQLAEAPANPGSWVGMGGMGGVKMSPNISNLQCLGLGGGVCPGK